MLLTGYRGVGAPAAATDTHIIDAPAAAWQLLGTTSCTANAAAATAAGCQVVAARSACNNTDAHTQQMHTQQLHSVRQG